ncbi:hypothetical protein PLUA15_200074 [Pseudomonas lundensis]|uniref:Uncharacterized protein n=1 Tax=Pseudomonas lundensis TaxID=86185 RepID=A0AAX2H595_9PSED|nr:hypothetical protein PLUA15_200074 [Pseudomonas lundensis]
MMTMYGLLTDMIWKARGKKGAAIIAAFVACPEIHDAPPALLFTALPVPTDAVCRRKNAAENRARTLGRRRTRPGPRRCAQGAGGARYPH